MADIPAHLEKEHVLEANDWTELSVQWDDWDSDWDYARRRRVIKRRMENTGFAVNTFQVREADLREFAVDGEDEFEHEVVVDGICFARAYYNGSSSTGEIFAGKPVVFDTFTGKGVTGIHSSWQPNEYTVVGTAMVDYSETDDEGQDIPIKLSSVGVPGEEGTGVLLFTNHRLPGRYVYNGDKVAGYFTAFRVKVETLTSSPLRYRLVTTDEKMTVIHPGRRDVRPHMYIWAQKLNSQDAPTSDMYVATAAFYE